MQHSLAFYVWKILFSSVQSFSRVQLFATPWITALQASLSITNSRSSPKLMCTKSVMPSSHLILCCPLLLLPPILPAAESFPMSQLFAWGSWNWSFSFSINTQDWSPLEWTGWISLQSKELSRVFSNTTVQKHQFFSAQLSSQSNSHIHTWLLEKPQPWPDGSLLAMSGSSVLHYLLEFAQIHVHWVGDVIQSSHPLLPSSFTVNLSQHQCLSQWVSSSHYVAKAMELQHQSFQWIFRFDLA